jgi:selenide,water dikinase
VTPVEKQVYSGMLPGYVAGHYALDECAIDLVALASRARARMLCSAAVRIDASAREVILADGEIVPYDVLSIDVGSRSFVGTARGVEAHSIPVRPLERFIEGWERVLARAREDHIDSVSIVGGGAAGIELAFAMEHRFRTEVGEGTVHVRILTDAPVLLPEYPDALSAYLVRLAARRNIGIHMNSAVAEVGPDFLRLKENIEFATDATFWVAGSAAHAFLGESGFDTDERGFLAVNDFLQSVSHPEVFGTGDCATNREHPRPKAGVFAVRAGPALAANLRAALSGAPLKSSVTRRRFLALLSCGNRRAAGVYGPLVFGGWWVWWWKDRIDRRFLARYGPRAPAGA